MDHDAVETRVAKIEDFLDGNAPGWREGEYRRRRRFGGEDRKESDLVVDEDKTQSDREALGITDRTVLRQGRPFTPGAGTVATGGDNPGIDDGKDAELRKNFRAGKGAVSDEELAKQERADIQNKLERFKGRDGYPELDADASTDQLRAALENYEAREREMNRGQTAAGAVALEGARSNAAMEQALKTAQDPDRQQRAEAQQDQARQVEQS